MEKQICLACGCYSGADAYKEEGVLYCCKPSANSGKCECDCCEVMEGEQEQRSNYCRGKESC